MVKGEKWMEGERGLENMEELVSVRKKFEEKSEEKRVVGLVRELGLMGDIAEVDEKEEE
ncbi:hypothetical protein [Bacillus subtilis]|uniref:hypothetical protein n=1 Tax=Bacillus subtilis TaxID=1423 RepID=UPI00164294FA|nr:hypothetical protein [Bacillus subtilis]